MACGLLGHSIDHDDVIETLSALLTICAGNSPVTGDFPEQRPVTRSFVFFDLHLNKRLNKQWWGWWFKTPSRPLWRHCNVWTSSGLLIVGPFATNFSEIKTQFNYILIIKLIETIVCKMKPYCPGLNMSTSFTLHERCVTNPYGYDKQAVIKCTIIT